MTLFAGMKIEEFYSVNYVEKTGSADTNCRSTFAV